MSLFLLAVIHSFLFQFVYSQSCTAETGIKLTFYGYPDGNSDTTSFGCSGSSPTGQGNNGGIAGGSGTYADPETFATALTNTKFTNCEIVYIPYFQKYFRYNDHCEQCATDLANGLTHLDLWIGSSTNGGQAQILCEETFGALQDQTIIINPPNNLPVNSGALWDGSTCNNSPSAGMVFPNPKTVGICSGGSSSSGGGSPAPAPAPSPSPAASTTVPTTTPVMPTPAAVKPPQQIKADVNPTPSPASPPSTAPAPSVPVKENIVVPPVAAAPSPPTPTTLVTAVSRSTPSPSPSPSPAPAANGGTNKGKTWTPGITYAQQIATAYAECATWNGCVGDPCQSYDNCAGEWVCIAGKCADNKHG